ncbi:MAG: hypothetical protein ABF913_04440 [Oenococcus sp.]|uniref:hypothetical protein n=1 Tax=Oenococcus sp. TaxID=1979414 RepID=UPI0039EB9899
MGLFIKEALFKTYMQQVDPKLVYEPGHAVISVNIVNLNPVTNCVYIGDDFFFAARYNDAFDAFSNGFVLTKNQIASITLKSKALADQLIIETTEEDSHSHQPLTLKMSLPKINQTSWHVKNLKLLRQRLAKA